MRLISIEDYAELHKFSLREVYALIADGKLKSCQHNGFIRVVFVYVDDVPEFIVSLDTDIEYLSQQKAAHRAQLPLKVMREKVASGEIKSIKIKNSCFIPADQFEVEEQSQEV
ncbi:hypothetical protein [Piscirickettsia salmonis]|uniref:hypothetical protein n=1 Tax=Piscirickettsia salmonis TaxID=1238 RepID=UPI0012BAC89A|nr:hypothetical protein [Piscirickettsia salmonis]QGP41354.1 hypothetical protein Psal182_03564 [Piscirickettsia salmonis]QGP57124.1 hypothetical protein PsalSR1_04613 [Piscirickettsia salmonis]